MHFKTLVNKQKKLDKVIFRRARIKKYPYVQNFLALLVELGELANEVEKFKYWKHNKKTNKNRALEEWADCFHFALSIESKAKQVDVKLFRNIKEYFNIFNTIGAVNDVDKAFLVAYSNIISCKDILLTVINLGRNLDFTLTEMEEAYNLKYKKNLKRQMEGY